MVGVTSSNVRYIHPAGVAPHHDSGRPLLSTAEGGFVAIDDPLLALWQSAPGRSLGDLTERPPQQDLSAEVPAALACLAEAGLLARQPARPVPSPTARIASAQSVTAIIVVSVPGELV